MSTSFIEDELPLPSFDEIFGEIIGKRKSIDLNNEVTCNEKKQKKHSRPKNNDREVDDQEVTETSGRWTNEEHESFLLGVMIHGRSWKKIQPYVKTRTLTQIRTHAQKIFRKKVKKFEMNNEELNERDRELSTQSDG